MTEQKKGSTVHEQGQQRDDTQRLAHDTPQCAMNKCMCVRCMKLIVLIGSRYASASSLGRVQFAYILFQWSVIQLQCSSQFSSSCVIIICFSSIAYYHGCCCGHFPNFLMTFAM